MFLWKLDVFVESGRYRFKLYVELHLQSNSLINEHIYIVPLQGDSSEALPIPTPIKR